mmetsp:Transcript_44954/g.108657  ORF Transcript_44954/g.108657 Transcript_44954/m.108657 type:complete len:205 (+) Transcript_44954:303-917(+)|eukprot:CAMPEP_0113619682 /NCGR_PEP_ID=MMETSP0017_2-20120614/10000_1 /TAXON_ID=2856 /ORGANISM="Cylindrotheca closterium" /LENGTH=204 /DNA_ID=CAMNT_0000529273 /DNA_START=159 /DNA_END=773 /DNA_ORIENTATION=+ /assembly_acc=CAM_ASM_000147
MNKFFTFLCLTTLASVSAFSTSSSFVSTSASTLPVAIQNGSNMEMKKGKANVPPNMRGQFKKQQEMAAMQRQMGESQRPGSDGMPVFNLFVRTKRQNVWYPCGSFKGDDRSAALAKSYSEGGFLSGISKKQLDGGIAGSLYQDLDKLKETVCRAYPQLRKAAGDFEFGYKLAFEGLSEEQAKEVNPVEPKENKGPLDGIRNVFS